MGLNERDFFSAASLYKLAVVLAAFEHEERRRLSFDQRLAISPAVAALDVAEVRARLGSSPTVREAIEEMIVVSSNAAGVALLDLLGREEIDRILRANGLKDTSVSSQRLITTPHDVALLLERFATGQAVSREASSEIVEILLRQEIDDRLPKYLPKGVPLAHKTGTLDFRSHDAGILYSRHGPVVIVAMTEDVRNGAETTEAIAQLGRAVFDYFGTYAPIAERFVASGSRACPFGPFRPQAEGPLSGRTIVLDPGHGGSEGSATFVLPDGFLLAERDVVLDVGLRLRDLLTARGATVHMTRCRDVALSLKTRAALANAADADLVVSLHVHGAEQPGESGTKVRYFAPADSVSAKHLLGTYAEPAIWETLSASRQLANTGLVHCRDWSDLSAPGGTAMSTDEPKLGDLTRAGISRRDFLGRGSAFVGAVAIGGTLAACGGDEEGAAPAPAEEGAAAPAEGGGAGGTVSWLSWPGHNDPTFIQPFTDETGITVKGKEYSGGDNMLALATTSPPGTYDVVQADAEYIELLHDAELLIPLDPAEFPGINDYWPEFGLESNFPSLFFDGTPYGFIQRFGHLNIAYNTEQLSEADVDTYEILWDPKVQGKVGWFDWWAHMGPISLYEGAKGSWWPAGELDPYNITDEQFTTMTESVFSLKPQTAGFYSIADVFTAFANGEIWIQPAGGDWTALLLEDEGHPVKAHTPKEGTIQWTECVGIFKDAKNPEGAKEFVRYCIGPRGQVQTAIIASYQASIPSKTGWELMNQEQPEWAERLGLKLDGPNILDFYNSGLVSIRKIPVQQTIEEWNDAWTQFKAL